MARDVLRLGWILLVAVGFWTPGTARAHTPHDVIEAMELSPRFSDDRTVVVVTRKGLLRSRDGGVSFKRVVYGLDARHRLHSLAISPYCGERPAMWLTTEGDGVYQSTDGGDSWRRRNAGLDELGLGPVAVAPDFCVSGRALVAGLEDGLYRIEGEGVWEKVQDGRVLTIAFAAAGSIFTGGAGGELRRSTDGGTSWSVVHRVAAECEGVTAVAPGPRRIFFGTQACGVWRSTDGGRSFERIGGGLDDPAVQTLLVAPVRGERDTVLMSTWRQGFYRSDDGGDTWHLLSRGLSRDPQANSPRFWSPHFRELRASDDFARDGVLFLGGYDGLFKSTDGGHAWKQVESLTQRRIEGLALSPDFARDRTLAIATHGGGAVVSTNGGDTWAVRNKGFHYTEMRLVRIAFSPAYTDDRLLFAESNYSFYISDDLGESWDRVKLGYQGWRRGLDAVVYRLGLRSVWSPLSAKENQATFPDVLAFSPRFAGDRTIFFGTRYDGVHRSTDGGHSWQSTWDGESQRVTALAISSGFAADGTLFTGITDEGIYKTTDAGGSWQRVLEVVGESYAQAVQLAISPAYPRDHTVFANTVRGLVVSRDGGESWRSLPVSESPLGDAVDAIAVSPDYARDATLVVSVEGRGLYRSEDGGASFQSICGTCNAENLYLRLIEYSPAYAMDATLFGASDEDLLRSTDRGDSWRVLPVPARYEEGSDYIEYRGTWERLKDEPEASGSSLMCSEAPGSRAVLPFAGTGVAWVGTRSPEHGMAKVFLDGVFQGFVDQYGETAEARATLFEVRDLDPGPHTIAVEVTAREHPRAEGHRTDVDGFDVFP